MIPAVKELFERFCESAADDLMRDGEVEFEVIFLTKANKLIICGSAMPEADDESDTLVSMLRLVAVAHGAVAACIIAEVWCDDDLASASSHRREALIVCVMYRDEGAVSVVHSKREILRDVSGKIIELLAPSEPPTTERCDESQGRLMRIMPRYQPSRQEQQVAKAMIDKFPSHVVHRMDHSSGMTLH
jgi:hypothetical protein